MNNKELVHVICDTTLDGYTQEMWPQFLYRPAVGDYVQGNKRPTLRIASITHLSQNFNPPSNNVPLLRIQLHK